MTSIRSQSQQILEEQQRFVNRVLDDTKHGFRKVTDEAQRQITRASQAFSDTQQQTIQAAEEIVDTYVETQKEIIKSIGSVLDPQMWNSGIAPERIGEGYARMVSMYADNAISATNLFNGTIFGTVGFLKSAVKLTKEYNKEISTIGAKTVSTAIKSIPSDII